jgi:putrescine transport system substrate-binding protein
MRKTRLSLLIAASVVLAGCGSQNSGGGTETAQPAKPDAAPAQPAGERVVNVYNWSDYIAEDTMDNFRKESGIRVVYDVFDSNETLEAKLVTGGSGYDVVVPSLSFLGRQIQAGVFQELDRSKLKNYGNLDPVLMERIAQTDPGNKHAIPYLWGTTGIGYNVAKIKEVLGADYKVESWSMVFEPETMAKLAGCGVTFLDTPSEMIPTVLTYLGENPNSFDEAVIEKGAAKFESIRQHVRYYHSSQYINDLANGDICVAVGWSGDIFQARDRAAEAANGVEIGYVIPKEGAVMWFDMMALPKDAKNVEEAYALIDYLLRPEVMAPIQDYVSYASGNAAALPLISAELRENKAVYPPDDVKAKLFTLAVLPPEVDRLYTRIWTRLKTGR